jgi:hypothetical protein
MLVNLTPHDINIVREDGTTWTIPASGEVARVYANTRRVDEFDGVPITQTFYGMVAGLPEPQDGVRYIVSALVAERVTDRTAKVGDILVPSETVRDEHGRIIGCKSLGIIR